ncbi:Ribosomal protein S12 methylthiotransferase RimO [[Clostridium] ultunense Esp]|uniref:Ribosomal protein uS12 methylthiotransferase RimO n=1 Tax=[Clostridium] ultunense Esp TaxID=1288971 RepID=M1Z5P4_9FIRM|nr:30S ribosomal protein S12 methylthiotransferase RimO [Schnuerera ultunensis]CCQ93069.1 Ribosomal protein S12 methylthiotransferase RimO [[Clostridium] ultunense Esp]SHD77074.1 Ribosomal protein S12 methylthiotransferase RimO [[Clostridium] ultunense Esp]
MDKKRVSIVTLGCSKNEIDSELMMGVLKETNYCISNSLEDSEVIIINTCGFIKDAKKESIDTIWEITRYKREGLCKYIILAGCLAERYSRELLEEIEEIDGIIGTGNIKYIAEIINRLEKGENKITLSGNIDEEYLEGINRQSFRPTEYVKISEGCNNYCTYCIIPRLRGKHRSRRMEDIIGEVEYLVDNGVKEIILIGQNTTDYGIDLYGEYKLHELLDNLNRIERLKWIRLLYLYPDNITSKLIYSIKNNDKVVKYLDMPLQHVNNQILEKMNRRTSKEDIKSLILVLRKEIPNIILRTTFIVGFPGESNYNFNELYNFIENTNFDKLGVFTYSREEGTPANDFNNQIDERTKKYRRNRIMELQQTISYTLNKKKIGNVYEAIVEGMYKDGMYIGRTYMDSPEIDGILYINSNNPLEMGQFVNVLITDCLEYDLIGEIVE